MANVADGSVRVLVVGPDDEVAASHASALDRSGLSVDACSNPDDCLDRLADVDCVVSTHRLDGSDGVTLLEEVRAVRPELPFVLVAREGDEAVASDAVRAGITDYVPADDGVPADLADRVVEAVEARPRVGRDRDVREVYERISDAFYAVDEDLRFTYVNENAEELLRADAEDLLGERVWDAFPEAAETAAYDAFQEAIETQQPAGSELYFEPLDIWVDARVYPSETGLSVYFRDVTERKERERELDFRTALLEAQAEATIDGFLVVDDDRNILYHNERFAEVWGIPDEILASGSDERAIEYVLDELANPDEFLETVEQLYADPMAESRDEVALVDGRWLDRYSAPVIGEDGTHYGRLWVFRDVTERKERERELAESRRRYRTLVDNFPDGAVVLFDEDLRYRIAGGETLDGADVTTDDMEGERMVDVVDEEVVADLAPHYRAALDGERREFQIESGDRIYEVHTLPIGDDGEVDAGIAISRDITERKEREWQLRQQRERLAALNNLNEVVRDINRELVKQSTRADVERVVCERLADSDTYQFAWIGTVDEETRGVLPSTAANAQGYLDDVTVRADEGGAGRGPAGTAIRTGEPKIVRDVETATEYESWRERARDRGFTAAAAVPIVHEDRSYGVLNVYTERENAFDGEERAVIGQLGEIIGLAIAAIERDGALREERAFIESLLSALPDVLYAFDRTGEFLRWNDRLAEVTGYSDKEIAEMGPLDFVPDDETETIAENIAAVVERGETVTVESAFETKGGERIPYEFTGAPFVDQDGTELGLVGIGRDITERRERERKLQHERERLEFVNRLLRHNLLNGLNAVRAQTGFLEQHVDDEASRHVEIVHDRTDDMIDLIQTLRSLMRAIVEREERELEPVDLGAVLRKEIQHVERSFEDAEVEVRGSLHDAGAVVADDLLEEVFENLLVNAVQHNDEAVPRVTVDVETDEATTTVHVVDNGPGIPSEIRDEIFEKGEHGFESPGTGFGLYLVREIVDMYGGSIDVGDAEPSGAKFSIALPRATEVDRAAGDDTARESGH